MVYRFFVNPTAGNGIAEKKWRNLQIYLDEQVIAYSVFFSKTSGAIEEQMGQLNQDQSQFVIIGGDGTLHEAINGLMKNRAQGIQRTLAYISAGSGNDFARSHHLAGDPITAFKRIHQQINNQDVTLLDVGEYINESTGTVRYFVNNIGIGIDATTVAFANQSKIKRWLNKYHLGGLSYFLAIFQSLTKQDAFDVVFTLKDQQKNFHTEKAFLITVSNQPYFGGGIKILPDASSVDGLFDIILVDRPKNLGRLIWLIGALLRGNHYQYSEVHHFKSSQIGLQSENDEYSHLDGEVVPARKNSLRLTSKKYPFYI